MLGSLCFLFCYFCRDVEEKKQSFGRVLASQGVHAISNFMLGPSSVGHSSETLKNCCDDFQEVAVQLEGMYPDLYKNVSSQMGLNIGYEQDKISEAYLQFANSLLYRPGETEPNIYWAKIVSLLCVSSGLAVDCARNGKWDTIPKIIESFDRIVAKILVGWIIKQNGWVLVSYLCQWLILRVDVDIGVLGYLRSIIYMW